MEVHTDVHTLCHSENDYQGDYHTYGSRWEGGGISITGFHRTDDEIALFSFLKQHTHYTIRPTMNSTYSSNQTAAYVVMVVVVVVVATVDVPCHS